MVPLVLFPAKGGTHTRHRFIVTALNCRDPSDGVYKLCCDWQIQGRVMWLAGGGGGGGGRRCGGAHCMAMCMRAATHPRQGMTPRVCVCVGAATLVHLIVSVSEELNPEVRHEPRHTPP